MISLLSSQLTRYCSDVLRSSDFMSHSSLRGIKLYKKHQTFQNYKSCIYYWLFIYSEGLQERWGTGYSGKENALTPATIGITASLHFLSALSYIVNKLNADKLLGRRKTNCLPPYTRKLCACHHLYSQHHIIVLKYLPKSIKQTKHSCFLNTGNKQHICLPTSSFL